MSNWYIDFDSTLYNTDKMANDTYEAIASYINKFANIEKEIIFDEIKKIFNRNNIYNIEKLCEYFEDKYNLEKKVLISHVDDIIANGSKYIFPDVIPFLEKLSKKGNTLHILTYAYGKDTLKYQMQKIYNCEISEYFDCIIVTAKPKHTLDLNYKDGIFVDDNPTDLKNLYEVNSKKVIRMKRVGAGYAKKELPIPQIKEYTNFSEISLDEEE